MISSSMLGTVAPIVVPHEIGSGVCARATGVAVATAPTAAAAMNVRSFISCLPESASWPSAAPTRAHGNRCASSLDLELLGRGEHRLALLAERDLGGRAAPLELGPEREVDRLARQDLDRGAEVARTARVLDLGPDGDRVERVARVLDRQRGRALARLDRARADAGLRRRRVEPDRADDAVAEHDALAFGDVRRQADDLQRAVERARGRDRGDVDREVTLLARGEREARGAGAHAGERAATVRGD